MIIIYNHVIYNQYVHTWCWDQFKFPCCLRYLTWSIHDHRNPHRWHLQQPALPLTSNDFQACLRASLEGLRHVSKNVKIPRKILENIGKWHVVAFWAFFGHTQNRNFCNFETPSCWNRLNLSSSMPNNLRIDFQRQFSNSLFLSLRQAWITM